MSPYVYRRGEVLARLPVVPWITRTDPPPAKIQDPKDFRPELCGTTLGYAQHRRFKNEKCAGCLEAQAKHSAAYRARKKAQQVLPKVRRITSTIGSDNPIKEGVRNGTH